MDSDIVYYVEDESFSHFEYKMGDYISDDELFTLFTFVKGKIHSTLGNFYQLEKAEENVNKNNDRYFITDSKGNQLLSLVIKPHVYTYLPADLPRFTLDDLNYFSFDFYHLQINSIYLG
jgi:hypothetical protein